MKLIKQKLQTLSIVLSALFFVNVAFSQNVERKVLYKFKENEELFKANFTFQTDNIHYYCLVSDESKSLNTDNKTDVTAKEVKIVDLIIDGKIIESKIGVKLSLWVYTSIDNDNMKINLLNAKESYYTYKNAEGWFLKYKGKKYGPYEDVEIQYNKNDYHYKDIIVFKQMGQYFALLPDERITGPYNLAKEARNIDIHYDYQSGNYIATVFQDKPWGTNVYYNGQYLYKNNNMCEQFFRFICNKKGDCFFMDTHYKGETWFNGQSIGKTSSYYKLTSEGKFAYIYYMDGMAYLNINGKEFGGFEQIHNYDINNKGNFIFRFLKDDKDYVNVNGKIVGMYDNIESYVTHFDGSAWLQNQKEFDEFGELGEETFGGGGDYDAPFETPMINDKGDYIFAYRVNGKYYVSINGRSEGPYVGTWKPYIDEKGNYMYICMLDGKNYVVRNGKKEEGGVQPYMTRNGHYIYQFQKNGKTHINVDGHIEIVDNLGYCHINENGQYAYTFSKDEIEYVCVNGKNYKAPASNGFWSIHTDIKNGFKAEYYVELGNKKSFDENYERFIYSQEGEIISVDTENSIQIKDNKILFSKNEKNIMQSDSKFPYVMINNQKYGNGKIISVGYNEKLNVFRWAALEDKELVVYEYKITN